MFLISTKLASILSRRSSTAVNWRCIPSYLMAQISTCVDKSSFSLLIVWFPDIHLHMQHDLVRQLVAVRQGPYKFCPMYPSDNLLQVGRLEWFLLVALAYYLLGGLRSRFFLVRIPRTGSGLCSSCIVVLKISYLLPIDPGQRVLVCTQYRQLQWLRLALQQLFVHLNLSMAGVACLPTP